MSTKTRRRVISKDNGVYILKTKRDTSECEFHVMCLRSHEASEYEYRVACFNAVENIFVNNKFLCGAFEDAMRFRTERIALIYAEYLDSELNTEYGVQTINQFQDFYWDDSINEESYARVDYPRY